MESFRHVAPIVPGTPTRLISSRVEVARPCGLTTGLRKWRLVPARDMLIYGWIRRKCSATAVGEGNVFDRVGTWNA